MKTIDLETFYKRISGHVKLVGDFLERREISSIIKMCRMKPYSLFTGELPSKTKLEKYWVDEFGNSLFLEDKNIFIFMNDTELEHNTTVSTDLFSNNWNFIIENCKSVCLMHGSYFDKDIKIITFYGNDEYLRSFILYGEECNRISSLLLGTNSLCEILKHLNNYNVVDIDVGVLDCKIGFKADRCVIGSLSAMKRNELLKGIV